MFERPVVLREIMNEKYRRQAALTHMKEDSFSTGGRLASGLSHMQGMSVYSSFGRDSVSTYKGNPPCHSVSAQCDLQCEATLSVV